MPLKFGKGFQRRKSSGNALEELANPPQPSFRVFERHSSKSLDGDNTLKRMSQGRPLSAGPQLGENLFVNDNTTADLHNRGSGGTNNSTSSGGHNDNSSASARFSSSSTLPSSTDVPLDDRPPPLPKDSQHVPIPPIPQPNPLSLRAAGRTFSFGRKKVQSPSTPAPTPRFTPQSIPHGYSSATRERAMTESSYASGSTVTPPKLLDSDLDLGKSDLDSFGNMFESFGKRKSQTIETREVLGLGSTQSPENMSPSTSKPPTKSYFGDQSPYNPSPIHVDRPQEVDSSPYSWSSHASQNGLIQSPSPTTVKSVSNLRESSTASQHGPTVVSSQPMPASSSNSLSHRPRMARPPSGSGAGLRRSSAYSSSRDSELWQDEDARLVKDSVNASRRLNRQSASLSPYQDHPETFAQPTSSLPTSSAFSHPQSASVGSQQKIGLKDGQRSSATLFDSDDQEFQSSRSRLESSQSTPRARQPVLFHEGGPSSFQTSPTSAKFAVPLRQAIPSTSKTMPNVRNKVMTPAQFNEYKREQEMSRISSDATLSEDSDDENENYEDDDETERNRQLARQRRKQEADLAVYRQQMMKVTGEQPSDLPNIGQPRVGTDRETMSTPDLTGRYATPTFSFDKPSEKTKGSDDEDDDVPLGILAAHGFPNKNRPPSTYSNVGSNPYIRYNSESYPPPPMSTAGASNETGKRLPPFARNLPPDPYYGAGLVNSSNREPPSFGNTAGGSVHGGPSQNLPPGGLVGVIAGEERARAMRRGSPNAQGNYGSPLPQGMPQMPMGMPPGMPTMPMMSPGDEAQIQVSQQMSHMMQLQLEWMQQMQNLVSGNIQQGQLPQLMQAQQQMMNHGYLSPPGQVSRPTSMASYSGPGTPALGQQAQQRAMSMMDPGTGQHLQSNGAVRMVAPSVMSGALGGQGYTHSIAPSERSNVGMPSRYRPVSIAPVDEAPRPNSRASTLMSGHLQIGNDRRSHMLSTTKPVPSTRQKARQKGITASDDDDEEGWEEMKKNREKKKSSWRTKKNEQDDIQDLYYPEAHDVL